MKLWTLIVFFMISSSSFAWTLEEVQGSYKASVTGIPMSNLFKIDRYGKVNLIQNMVFFIYKCEGEAEIVNDVLFADLVCNGDKLVQARIDASNVKTLDKFTASVWTSISGDLKAKFTKVK